MSQLSKFIDSTLMIGKEAITVQYIQAEVEEVTHYIEVVSLTVSPVLICMHMCNTAL